MARRLIGTATTNSSGIATISYTGAGAGKLQLVAESGNLESEIYELIDAIWFDEATTGHENSNLWINSNLTKTASSTGTLIENTSSSNYFFGLNKPGATPSGEYDLYDWTEESFAVEMDVVNFDGNVIFQIIDQSNTHLFQRPFEGMLGASATNKHLKIVANGTDVRCYVDGVENTSMKVITNFTTNYRIVVKMDGEGSIKFKNLVYYPV